MDIKASQVGQNLAVDTRESGSSSKAAQEIKPEQTKDLSISAEIDKQTAVDVSTEQVDAAVTQLREFSQNNNRQLNFSVDEGSNKQVVKVTDSQSGDVIRQIPSEEILALSERLQDLQTDDGTTTGLLFNKQV